MRTPLLLGMHILVDELAKRSTIVPSLQEWDIQRDTDSYIHKGSIRRPKVRKVTRIIINRKKDDIPKRP